MIQKMTCAKISSDSVILHGRLCLKWRSVKAMPILTSAMVGIHIISPAKSRCLIWILFFCEEGDAGSTKPYVVAAMIKDH